LRPARPSPRAFIFVLRERRNSLVPCLLRLVIALVPAKRPLRRSIESKRESVPAGKAACYLLYFTSRPAWSAALELPGWNFEPQGMRNMQGVMISRAESTDQIIREVENNELHPRTTDMMAHLARRR
jgi:hypothetical protein